MTTDNRTALARQAEFVIDLLLFLAVLGLGICFAMSVCEVEPPSLSFTTDLPETSMK